MSIVSGGKWLCCVSVPGAGSWTSSNKPWDEFVASAHFARKVEAAFFARLTCVSACCRGKQKRAGEYEFKWAEANEVAVLPDEIWRDVVV